MGEKADARTVLLLALIVTGLRLAAGQTTAAALSGVVTDHQGGVIPGVDIQLKNLATGAVWTVTTDRDGRYGVFDLEPGSYELHAEKPRFNTAVQTPVSLSVAETATFDFQMSVGDVKQIVVVTGIPLVDTTESGISRVVGTNEIQALPNIGRNFVDFVKLDASVHLGRENVGGGAFKEPDAGVGVSAVPRLSFGGQSELNTMIQVDGANNVQTFTGLPRATPSQEAAQEFRVLDSTYLAEYGGSLGGFVNIVTTSGTQYPHGSLYYFGINNALDAVPILAQPDTYVLRHNQFGSTLGGPIEKDRAFVFLSYEGQRHEESNNFAQFLTPSLVASINNVLSQFPGLKPQTLDQVRSADY